MATSPPQLTNRINLAIIGAGPHALTFVTHLLQKRPKIRGKFLVFDPSGTWLSRWEQQFAALEIPHLRSPAVHHPDPNPFALRKFAQSRPQELFPPYDLPGTRLFEDLCHDVIQRWDIQDVVVPAKVKRLEPLHQGFRLWLQDGESIIAKRVILATNNSQIQIPDWVNEIASAYPEDQLCHSQEVDLRKLHLAGERVLIVGGGLTSGHLALGAMTRGAKVQLLIRRQLQAKLFDAEPGWLGPKYLKGFFATSDYQLRSQMIQKARNGGSMTPAMAMQLRRFVRAGQAIIDENCEILAAQWLGHHWQVKCNDGNQYECDRIWLSTGSKFDVQAEPLLQEVFNTYPIPIVNGLPVLDTCLRWPGCELFLMGGLAALQIGPTARNLSGARMASEKIVPAIIKPSVVLPYPKIA
jgi:cation diffusion facilitator CzcD-associated flavoprotein CzcO